MITIENVQNGNSLILSNEKNEARDIIINEIINHVEVMNLKIIEGWDNIPFQKINALKNQTHITTGELSVLLDFLENKAAEMRYQMLIEEYYINNNISTN